MGHVIKVFALDISVVVIVKSWFLKIVPQGVTLPPVSVLFVDYPSL